MTTIITSDSSTDEALVSFLYHYVVEVDGVDIYVTGSGSDEFGFVTIEGLLWTEDDEVNMDEERSFRFDTATITVY